MENNTFTDVIFRLITAGFLFDLVTAALLMSGLVWIAFLVITVVSRLRSKRTHRDGLDLEPSYQELRFTKKEAWLIHGTWARKAAWTLETDAGQGKLRSAVAGSGFTVRRLNWSGQNSILARSDAAKRLAADIRKFHTDHTDGKLTLIGHSHGGTVALNALQKIETDEQYKKDREKIIDATRVFCMSSPILVAASGLKGIIWRRADDLYTALGLTWLILLVMAAWSAKQAGIKPKQIDISLEHVVNAAVGQFPDGAAGSAPFSVDGLWLLVTCGFLSTLMVWSIRHFYLKRPVDGALEQNAIEGADVRFLKTTGDEAQGLLTGMFIAARIMNIITLFVFSAAHMFHAKVQDGASRGAVSFSLFAIATFLIGVAFVETVDWLSKMMIILAMLSFLLAIGLFAFSQRGLFGIMAWFVALVLLPFTLPFRALAALPFGVELAALGSWRLATIEHTPPGEWKSLLIVPGDAHNDKTFLDHSFIYNHPRAVQYVEENLP